MLMIDRRRDIYKAPGSRIIAEIFESFEIFTTLNDEINAPGIKRA